MTSIVFIVMGARVGQTAEWHGMPWQRMRGIEVARIDVGPTENTSQDQNRVVGAGGAVAVRICFRGFESSTYRQLAVKSGFGCRTVSATAKAGRLSPGAGLRFFGSAGGTVRRGSSQASRAPPVFSEVLAGYIGVSGMVPTERSASWLAGTAIGGKMAVMPVALVKMKRLLSYDASMKRPIFCILAFSLFVACGCADRDRAKKAYESGVSALLKGEDDKAIADCTEAIRLDPKDSRVYYCRALAYDEKGDLDNAIADLTEAIKLDPKYSDAYRNRGVAYGEKGDHDKMLADCTEAIRLNPEFVAAYRSRGIAYLWKGDYDQAVANFTEAIRLNPNNADVYSNRGAAYWNKHEYDKLIADCTEAIQLDPKYAAAYHNRGMAYGSKGEYDKAIADFSQAILLKPKDGKAYYEGGLAYEKKGDKAKAEEDFEQAKKLGYKGK